MVRYVQSFQEARKELEHRCSCLWRRKNRSWGRHQNHKKGTKNWLPERGDCHIPICQKRSGRMSLIFGTGATFEAKPPWWERIGEGEFPPLSNSLPPYLPGRISEDCGAYSEWNEESVAPSLLRLRLATVTTPRNDRWGCHCEPDSSLEGKGFRSGETVARSITAIA